MLAGALEEDATDQVVGDGVGEEFAPDQAGGEVAPAGCLPGGLKVVEVEFDPPAARIKGWRGWPRVRGRGRAGWRGAGGAGCESGHGRWGRAAFSKAGAHDAAGIFVGGTFQGDEPVVAAETPAFSPVDPRGVASSHEEVGAAQGPEGGEGKAPEATVGDEEVARTQVATQEDSAAQAKEARQVDERPAATGFLEAGLGPLLLVVPGVGSGHGTAIDNEHATLGASGPGRAAATTTACAASSRKDSPGSQPAARLSKTVEAFGTCKPRRRGAHGGKLGAQSRELRLAG